MKYHVRLYLTVIQLAIAMLLFNACGLSSPLRAKIHENDEWSIRLRHVDKANNGRGYSHPASIPHEKLVQILEGISIASDYLPDLPLDGDPTERTNHRAVFNKVDAELLAIFLGDGFAQASREEMVTFVKTTDLYKKEEITSGGFYFDGDELHVVLSNFRIKQLVWQDADEYQAPVRTQPMKSIASQPGQIVFDNPQLAREVPSSESDFKGMWSGISWHLAIQYKTL